MSHIQVLLFSISIGVGVYLLNDPRVCNFVNNNVMKVNYLECHYFRSFIVSLSVYLFSMWIHSNNNKKVNKKDSVEWKHDEPIDRLNKTIKKYGEPSHYNYKQGGFAHWKGYKLSGTPYCSILIKDEEIYHSSPKPHCDFMYTSVLYDIPDEILPKVLSISKSVWYDRLKKKLTARCHMMKANIATIYLALLLSEGLVNNVTQEDYGNAIMKGDEEMMYNKINEMVKLKNTKQYLEEQNKMCENLKY